MYLDLYVFLKEVHVLGEVERALDVVVGDGAVEHLVDHHHRVVFSALVPQSVDHHNPHQQVNHLNTSQSASASRSPEHRTF